MSRRLAQLAILVAPCIITSEQSSHAQIVANPSVPGVSCPQPNVQGQPDSSPEISIEGVSFSGALQIPVADQDEIAESVKRETHGNSVEGVTNEALERVRAGWQNRGYFKVLVNGQARTLASSAGNQPIELFVNVNDGAQYRLSGITFKNKRAISKCQGLAPSFPDRGQRCFSREKIGKGLENLRYAYLEIGYLNFTSVPDTLFDDERGTLSLEIDVDEGKQFYVRSIEIRGLDESAAQEILKTSRSAKSITPDSWTFFSKSTLSSSPRMTQGT